MSDCEIAQYYVTTYRTARKEHDCVECSAPILPDEEYLEVRACWEGRPSVYRQHLICQQACDYVRDKSLNDDDCIEYGGLKEWYKDWVQSGLQHVDSEPEERSRMWRFMLQIKRRERRASETRNKSIA